MTAVGQLVRAHPSASATDIFSWGAARNLLPDDGPQARYTFKARGAIFQYLKALSDGKRTEVLLPAYHCPTIVHAVERAGLVPRYYGVNDNLSIDESSLSRKLGPCTAVVLVINFFGFPTVLGQLGDAIHAAGALLLEDCSHSFLYANPLRMAGERGDAAVYALWKLVPAGVGGLVTVNCGVVSLSAVNGRVTPRTWLRYAKRLVEESVENLPDGLLRRGLLAVEQWRVRGTTGEAVVASADAAPAEDQIEGRYPIVDEDFDSAVPALQKYILMHAKLETVAHARRENFKTLLAALCDCAEATPLFSSLPETVVPWCFPIRIRGRRLYDYRMRERGVPLFTFGETLHPSLFSAAESNAAMLATARALRDNVLCIGVHQNLDRAVLECAARNIIEVLRQGPAERSQVAG